MQQVPDHGLSKRARLSRLLRASRQRKVRISVTRFFDAAIWQTLRRGLSPIRHLAAGRESDPNEVELFVTRLEERRVLNGDFGMLAGVADIVDPQADLELYQEMMLGTDPITSESGYDGSYYSDGGVFGSQAHDLNVTLGAGDSVASQSLANAPSPLSLRMDPGFMARGEGTNMAPAFTADPFTFSVAENSDVGTVVGVATATDVDSPVLAYSITAGDPGGAFAIDSATGQITVADQSAIDFESTPSFALTVQVADNNAMMPLTDTAVVNIGVTDLQTTLTISSPSDLESSGVLVFDVTATGDDINQAFSVNYETVDNLATDATGSLGSNDYDGTNAGSLAFDGNATSETESISITVNDDSTVELNEDFLLNLLSATSNDVTINAASGTGTILNDDTTTISISDVVKSEGDAGTTDFEFLITSSNLSDSLITLTANTIDGSAVAGSDYNAITNDIISIAPGTSTATVAVLVNGDTDVEVTETFLLSLSNATYAGIPATGASHHRGRRDRCDLGR